MLFKEKLVLTNCDSVRQLGQKEITKRFLTGLTFGDGVILTPTTLLDNEQVHLMLERKNVLKYLNEEGLGKIIVRGFNLGNGLNLPNYLESLPGDFIFSSIENTPRKSDLTLDQHKNLIQRLKKTQKALDLLNPTIEDAFLNPNSLRDEILARIKSADAIGTFFNSNEERQHFEKMTNGTVSRSEWYALSTNYFGNSSSVASDRFKSEIIDPSYNSLFAVEGEGFLQDNIKLINNIPGAILDAGVTFKSLRNEIKYIEYPILAFEMISSLGTGEILKWFTDEALNYIEDKFTDKGEAYLSRKNWFGMYDLMKNKIGLEIK